MIGSHCTKKRCFLQLQTQQLLSKISLELSTSGSGERHALSASLQTCDTPLDPFPSAQTLQGSSNIRRSHAPFGRLGTSGQNSLQPFPFRLTSNSYTFTVAFRSPLGSPTHSHPTGTSVQLSNCLLSILHHRGQTAVLARLLPGHSARGISRPIYTTTVRPLDPPYSRPRPLCKASHASPLPFPLSQPGAGRARLHVPNNLKIGSVPICPFPFHAIGSFTRLVYPVVHAIAYD